jgi:hypothetical protein
MSASPPKADIILVHSRRQLLANAAIAASRVIAVCRRAILVVPEGHVHIRGIPTGAALALKMRPTTAPSASTSSV